MSSMILLMAAVGLIYILAVLITLIAIERVAAVKAERTRGRRKDRLKRLAWYENCTIVPAQQTGAQVPNVMR